VLVGGVPVSGRSGGHAFGVLAGRARCLAHFRFIHMGRAKTDQLSSEEAKRRFREAADQVGIAAWVRHQPYRALALSFVAGLVLANGRLSRDELISLLVRLLATPGR
jgi:hypothetical protein